MSQRHLHALSIIPMFLAVALLAGCAGGPAPATTAPGAVSSDVSIAPGDDVVLVVWGMSCPKCVSNVDQLLRDIPGVDEVRTDMSAGTVTIRTGRVAPDPDALADAISEAGFTLMRIDVAGRDA